MFPFHFRYWRLLVFATMFLAFSAQDSLTQVNIHKNRVRPKQTDTLQTKKPQIKTKQAKSQQTTMKHMKPQQTSMRSMKPQPTSTKEIKTQQPKARQIKTREGRVTQLTIGVKPTSFNGDCPAIFDFHCTIKVNHSPVKVDYEWVRSDGTKGEKQQVEIRNTSVTVSDIWKLGGAKQHLREWEMLHVISPKDMNSARCVINVNCR